MHTLPLAVVVAVCPATVPQTPGSPPPAVAAPAASRPQAADQDQRMTWWRQARFGMFVHWGLYAIPAGAWQGGTDFGEWIRDSAHIPVGTYERFQPQWNPALFDADAWATMAAAAGMQYLVLTSKHHDGFCLFDSKETDWDVMKTPFGRDICKELAAACARHGVRFCTYHSIMDWHHPDYLPRRPWEQAERPADAADFARFERYLHAQVTEVIEQYRPAVMWFDGEWENTWNHERGVRLFELCRRLAPEMIVNNRVDVHRSGMGGFSGSSEAVGDFATPEQEIPGNGIPGVDWESCMTMNRHWGWNEADTDWKSTKELLHNLIDIASKGGNYLLNVGPRADGTFPPQAKERLAAIGRWMQQNGEAIHGTTASAFDALPWGRCTVRRQGDTTKLYFHVFDWPNDGRLALPDFGNEILGQPCLLGDPQQRFRWHTPSSGNRAHDLSVPAIAPDPIATVLVVEIKGAPIVYRQPTITAESDEFVTGLDVFATAPSPDLDVHGTTDGTTPDRHSPRLQGPLHLSSTCTVKVRAYYALEWESPVVERTFTKVEPSPAVEPVAAQGGLLLTNHVGPWERIPDRRQDLLVAPMAAVAATVDIGRNPGENVLLRFTGFLDAPADELYRFALSSDDGSGLWIDGQSVVDNDGLHSSRERRGALALAKGLHPVEVVWFNRTGSAELTLRWARPGHLFEPIPAGALRH